MSDYNDYGDLGRRRRRGSWMVPASKIRISGLGDVTPIGKDMAMDKQGNVYMLSYATDGFGAKKKIWKKIGKVLKKVGKVALPVLAITTGTWAVNLAVRAAAARKDLSKRQAVAKSKGKRIVIDAQGKETEVDVESATPSMVTAAKEEAAQTPAAAAMVLPSAPGVTPSPAAEAPAPARAYAPAPEAEASAEEMPARRRRETPAEKGTATEEKKTPWLMYGLIALGILTFAGKKGR